MGERAELLQRPGQAHSVSAATRLLEMSRTALFTVASGSNIIPLRYLLSLTSMKISKNKDARRLRLV